MKIQRKSNEGGKPGSARDRNPDLNRGLRSTLYKEARMYGNTKGKACIASVSVWGVSV